MSIEEELKYWIKKLKESNQDDAILKAKMMLAFVLQQKKEYLITHNNEKLTKSQKRIYSRYMERLLKNEPIQYILETQEFMGLEFEVNKNVLIPRQDTETLVEEVISKIKNEGKIKVLDLCTGSGAIAISLKNAKSNIEITASDISSKALKIAKRNSRKLDKKVEFIRSDLFKNINNKFDVIVSNPPYIRRDEIEELSKDVQKEPKLALDGGVDGLDIYRKIICEAYKYLENNGILALEIGYDQKDDVIELIKKSKKYDNIYSKKDLGNNDRIIICQRKEEC